jgi:ribonuclease P protein component
MPRKAREHGYSRRHRFSASGSFGPVLRSGRKLRGEAIVVHAAEGRPGASRLGVALTRRLVPSAVDRNLAKRVLREIFRRHPLKHAGLDCVITLRQPFRADSAAAIRAEATRFFDLLGEGRGR